MNLEQTRAYFNNPKNFPVVHPVYLPHCRIIVRVDVHYRMTKADQQAGFRSVNSSNSVHCPRWVTLLIRPETQLCMFEDGFISDQVIIERERVRARVEKNRKNYLCEVFNV